MNEHKDIDSLEEALRIIYLENAKESDPSDSEKQMAFILVTEPVKMKQDKYQAMMRDLAAITQEVSFGQLLQQSMDNAHQGDLQLASIAQLPTQVIGDLKQDTLYTNNVPIVLFKKLLEALNISYTAAEKAILKTFDILQSQASLKKETFSGFSPAFRKGYYSSRDSINKNSPKVEGKELFENKEALDKYLARLHELMK